MSDRQQLGVPCPDYRDDGAPCPTELQHVRVQRAHEPELRELSDQQRGVALHLIVVHAFPAGDAAAVVKSWCE